MRGHNLNNKEIDFLIDTIEDMNFNPQVHGFFDYLRNLIKNKHEITFYRKGSVEGLTTIRDIDHLENFIRSFKITV